MASAGYSGKPLSEKLGIKPGMKILLINIPGNYFELTGKNVNDQSCNNKEVPDLIHVFVQSAKEFKTEMKKLNFLIKKNPKIIIWVSWYKKSAQILTDLSEDVIRNYALKNNLVDIKVCAIDEKWSGLKLVVPLAKR
jgi:hypothetical protein